MAKKHKTLKHKKTKHKPITCPVNVPVLANKFSVLTTQPASKISFVLDQVKTAATFDIRVDTSALFSTIITEPLQGVSFAEADRFSIDCFSAPLPKVDGQDIAVKLTLFDSTGITKSECLLLNNPSVKFHCTAAISGSNVQIIQNHCVPLSASTAGQSNDTTPFFLNTTDPVVFKYNKRGKPKQGHLVNGSFVADNASTGRILAAVHDFSRPQGYTLPNSSNQQNLMAPDTQDFILNHLLAAVASLSFCAALVLIMRSYFRNSTQTNSIPRPTAF